MTARGIRNNNPGNLRHGQKWQGLAAKQPDPDFCTFQSMAYGIRALVKLLQTYRSRYDLTTIRGIISRWAPPNENDTEAYIRAVASDQYGADQQLPDDRATYEYLARRIALHENGRDALKISEEDWRVGVGMAFGITPAAPPALEPRVPLPPTPLPPLEPAAPWPFRPDSAQALVSQPKGGRPMLPAVLPAVVAAVLPSIVQAIPSLTRIFGSGSQISERNARAAEVVADIVTQATGATNIQDAAERIQSDPVARQTAAQAVEEQWYDISETGGGGIEGARKFAAEMTSGGPMWRQIGFGFLLAVLAIGIVLGGGIFMAYSLVTTEWDAATKAQIIAYFQSAGMIVIGYIFGSSAGSRKKDDARDAREA